MFKIDLKGLDRWKARLEEQVANEAAARVAKSIEQTFCPIHQQFARVTGIRVENGQVHFNIEGCCEHVVQEAHKVLGGTSVAPDRVDMNRALRRCILVELFPRSDELFGPHLSKNVPAKLNVDPQELKSTCQLMASEGLLYMDEIQGLPEEYVVQLEAKGREAYKERNDEISLWLDILWVLRADQREELKLSKDGRRLIDPVKVLGEVLVDSKESLLRHALNDLHNKGFVKVHSANNNVILAVEILASGKIFLKQGYKQSPGVQMTNIDQSVRIEGNSGSIINLNSSLTKVSQKIEESSLSKKDDIAEKLQELAELLKEIPTERSEDAESVHDAAAMLVKEATKTKPVKNRLEISAEGLKEAAEAVSDIAPKVLPVASMLAQLLVFAAG